jgi:hypothetical protein
MGDEGTVRRVHIPGVYAVADHTKRRWNWTMCEVPREAVREALAIVDHEIARLMTGQLWPAPSPTSFSGPLEALVDTRCERRSLWRRWQPGRLGRMPSAPGSRRSAR